MRYDVDAVAVRPDGLPVFAAYRAQPVYDYQTITVRWANHRGNEDVQLAKLLDHRSRADVYVQGYPSGVAYATATDLRVGFHVWAHQGMSRPPGMAEGRGRPVTRRGVRLLCRVIYVLRGEDPFRELVW